MDAIFVNHRRLTMDPESVNLQLSSSMSPRRTRDEMRPEMEERQKGAIQFKLDEFQRAEKEL